MSSLNIGLRGAVFEACNIDVVIVQVASLVRTKTCLWPLWAAMSILFLKMGRDQDNSNCASQGGLYQCIEVAVTLATCTTASWRWHLGIHQTLSRCSLHTIV